MVYPLQVPVEILLVWKLFVNDSTRCHAADLQQRISKMWVTLINAQQ